MIPRTSSCQSQEKTYTEVKQPEGWTSLCNAFGPFIMGCIALLQGANMNADKDFVNIQTMKSTMTQQSVAIAQRAHIGCEKFRRAHFEEVSGVWHNAPVGGVQKLPQTSWRLSPKRELLRVPIEEDAQLIVSMCFQPSVFYQRQWALPQH